LLLLVEKQLNTRRFRCDLTFSQHNSNPTPSHQVHQTTKLDDSVNYQKKSITSLQDENGETVWHSLLTEHQTYEI
jgi:hypothetical protein